MNFNKAVKFSEKGIISPHQNDVLSGRGNNVNLHSGNKNYRSVVQKLKNEYIAAPKPKKPQYARMVVDAIRNLNPPGRFLKQDSETKLWFDIGDKKAIDKARQALREGAPDIIQQSSGILEVSSCDKESAIERTISPASKSSIESEKDSPVTKGKISPIPENEPNETSPSSTTRSNRRDSLESFPGHEGEAQRILLRESFQSPGTSAFTELRQSLGGDMRRNSLYTDDLFGKEAGDTKCLNQSSLQSENTARLLQKIYGPDLVNLPLGRRDSAIIRGIYENSISDATTLASSGRTASIGKDFQNSMKDLMCEQDFDVSMNSTSSNAIHNFVEQLIKKEREKMRDSIGNPSWLTDDEFNESNMSEVIENMASLNAGEDADMKEPSNS